MSKRLLSVVLCVVVFLGLASSAAAQDSGVGAWSASPQPPYSSDTSQVGFADQTVRNIVHSSVGGSGLRVRISNEFGENPLEIGAASVALRDSGSDTLPGTSVGLTFDGNPSVEIPVGEEVYSDQTAFESSAGDELAVSLYLPEATGPTTWHALGQQLSYFSNPGDHTSGVEGTAFSFGETSSFFLTGVEVYGAAKTGTVVAVGDSITDGFGSTLNANGRYPDYLARRAFEAGTDKALVNAGISGNRILNDSACCGTSLVERFERDVLSQPNVTDVILLEGINDIGFSRNQGDPDTRPHTEVSADEIIAGMQRVIDRAHAEGVRVHGGTLLPFEGADYYYEEGEEKREAVNDFIRNSGEFDSVVDFDAAMRDPDDPERLLPAYDSGDHLHPNDAGYRKMAQTVDLEIFGQQPAGRVPDTGGPSPLLPISAVLLSLGVVALAVKRRLS